MQRCKFVLLMLSLIGSSLMTLQAQSQKPGEDEKAIQTLEQQWAQGMQKSNPDAIAPMLADSYVFTDIDGKVYDRAQSLQNMKTAKMESVENSDVTVTVYGTTAIARGVYKAKGADSSGKSADVHARWTDTWIKMKGKWQCVATQSTSIKE